MVKFGASIYGVSRDIISGKITPEYGVKWLAENGAEALELVPFGIDFLGDPEVSTRIKQAADEVGIPIENFSLNANFLQITDEEYAAEVQRAKQFIDICVKMEIPSIRVDCSSFRRPIETNTIENFMEELPTVIKTYSELCDYAAPHGITVLLENHGFHINGSDVVRLILREMKKDNFGIQMDVGNFICVDEDCEVATAKIAPYAKTIHFKDFYIRPSHRDPGDASQFDCSNSWFRSRYGRFLRGSILGQGDLDIYQIMGIIKKAGYEGTIFLEYEGMEDCYYGTKVSLDNMKRIYALV